MEDKNIIFDTLSKMPASMLTEEEVVSVEKDLNSEGLKTEDWRAWIGDDPRFSEELITARWETFDKETDNELVYTIYKIAHKHGIDFSGTPSVDEINENDYFIDDESDPDESDTGCDDNSDPDEPDTVCDDNSVPDEPDTCFDEEKWRHEVMTQLKESEIKFDDNYPQAELTSDYRKEDTVLPPMLIENLLFANQKMMVSGASKAGKSFLLIALALALSCGGKWLGLKCRRSKVLYVNLEIEKAFFMRRVTSIAEAMDLPKDTGFLHLPFRGYGINSITQLTDLLLKRHSKDEIDVVIIDPLYKVLWGDENSARDIGDFCKTLDRLSKGLDCAIIYAHHHSKCAQGGKYAMDRASGSGVFARDCDVLLDLIELNAPDVGTTNRTAWRVETLQRELPSLPVFNIWFEAPLHKVDEAGELAGSKIMSASMRNLGQSSKSNTDRQKREALDSAYDSVSKRNEMIHVRMLAAEMGVTDRTVRSYLKQFSDSYANEDGIVSRKTD